VKVSVLARLALSGGLTDRIRVTLTAVSAALAALLLLSAAAVTAIPELGVADDGSEGWNQQYSSPLLAEPGLRPGVVVTLLLVAIPVLFLAGQSIRFGAPARDRRLAAIRLAGATPGQSVLIAAAETTLAALIGAVAGTGVFLLLRMLLNHRDARGLLPLPTDVLPSAVGFILVLVIVPVLAGLIGAFLLRRVIITPLGVLRRTRGRAPRFWPGLLIIAGVFAPLLIHPLGLWLLHLGRRTGFDRLTKDLFVVTGFVVVLLAVVGVIVGTGWIGHTAGRLLYRYGARPGMLLAGRRLMSDPWSGSRTLSALLAAVIVGAGVLGYRALMVTQFAADAAASRATGADGGFAENNSFYLNSVRLVQVAVVIGVVIAAAGIMVALTEGIVSRRRTYAALVAAGVPRRVLGESLAWQTLAPLLPALLIALTVGVSLVRSVISQVTAGGYATCATPDQGCSPQSPGWTTTQPITMHIPVPLDGLAALGAAALAAMLLVVAVGYFFLKKSTDIEELRVG
jgi:hypothetical protein